MKSPPPSPPSPPSPDDPTLASGAAAPVPVALPRSIGPYRVVSELDRGGMGVLYLALDPRLERVIERSRDREIAIKWLPSGDAASNALRTRFMAEARTTGGAISLAATLAAAAALLAGA